MDWGPTPAVANQILYTSYLNSGIYRVTEGSNNLGTKLVNLGIEQVIDVQWLPDGSGFLFTKGNFLDYANVYRYDFATSAATPLTQFTDEFAIDVSVSPDGQWIVFERSETNEFTAGDLWIMRWDGTEMRLLVQNGLRPSWSQHALPPPLIPRNYIPLVLR
jgi:Tol biopolymer transport system component